MSAARSELLERIRRALGPAPVVPEVPRLYRLAGTAPEDGVVERFCERVAAYRATVRRCGTDEVTHQIEQICADHSVRRLAVAPGIEWRPSGVEVLVDAPLTLEELVTVDGALTGSGVAIAETGTIVLDASPVAGRRALTLVPDLHVCVVLADQIVAGVPEAIAATHAAALEGRPLTFVSGPSATSDIELERVEGVHGPRRLEVIVVG
jgi:L-lactate dehydrogenase complex protein LldG